MQKTYIIFLISLIVQVAQPLMAQDFDLVTLLSSPIKENSGLIYFNGNLITHTDSGGENALYEIDTLNGNILRTVYVENASNIDWEDICYDGDYIYIGDFGNNSGARSDLRIYKVSYNDYFNATNDTVTADSINFSYANQTDFTPGSNQTNFDAEAIIPFGNMLYIFSKNWLNKKCDVYELSKIPGDYNIVKVDSFDSQGLITGADYNEETNRIMLIGYGPPFPFLIQISDFTGFPITNSQIDRRAVQVPSGTSVQIEAITKFHDSTYFISAEESVLGPAALSKFDVEALVGITNFVEDQRLVYPIPSKDIIHVELKLDEYMECYTADGRFVYHSENADFIVSDLPDGNYRLVFKNKEGLMLSQRSIIIK